MEKALVDYGFKVRLFHAPVRPNFSCWLAMHQDYSEEFVSEDEGIMWFPEHWYGKRIVKHLLSGNRGHWGCLEHSGAFSFNIRANHHTLMQLRTHRIAVTFDYQSFRYTGRYLENIERKDISKHFYIRPGKDREKCYNSAYRNVLLYRELLEEGSMEMARSVLPDYYQNGVITFQCVRSLLHMADLRLKKDAQEECRVLMWSIYDQARLHMPDVFEWYEKHRLGKAILSP